MTGSTFLISVGTGGGGMVALTTSFGFGEGRATLAASLGGEGTSTGASPGRALNVTSVLAHTVYVSGGEDNKPTFVKRRFESLARSVHLRFRRVVQVAVLADQPDIVDEFLSVPVHARPEFGCGR